MLPEAERSAEAVEQGKTQFTEVARVLSNALAGRSFILGEQFSAADVMIGSCLWWASFMGLVTDPTLQAYLQRLSERPAFKRAQA